MPRRSLGRFQRNSLYKSVKNKGSLSFAAFVLVLFLIGALIITILSSKPPQIMRGQATVISPKPIYPFEPPNCIPCDKQPVNTDILKCLINCKLSTDTTCRTYLKNVRKDGDYYQNTVSKDGRFVSTSDPVDRYCSKQPYWNPPLPTITPTPIPSPTSILMRLDVPPEAVYISNYNGDAHFDFYLGNVKKYYGFFSAESSPKRYNNPCQEGYGPKVYIGETIEIPTVDGIEFYFKSTRTNAGIVLSFIYGQKEHQIFQLPIDADTIIITLTNSNLVQKAGAFRFLQLACLKDS